MSVSRTIRATDEHAHAPRGIRHGFSGLISLRRVSETSLGLETSGIVMTTVPFCLSRDRTSTAAFPTRAQCCSLPACRVGQTGRTH